MEQRRILGVATTDAGMTIDELARETGMTVRNIRAHQSRGLLPPPEVRARTGYYGPDHVARLRLIQELQGNGYNLAAIKDLLDRSGGSAEQILGFTQTLLTPQNAEQPEVVDLEELQQRFGTAGADGKLLARAERLGLVAPLGGGRFEVPSPTVLRAGEAVLALGIPLDKALDIVERLTKNADRVSETFVRIFFEQVWKPFDEAGRPEAEWAEVRETLERLRPLVSDAYVAILQQRTARGVERAFGQALERHAKH
jgi:DNA-binding transcriptional MerR regulator